MEIKKVIKLVKDNCNKETIETGREDEIRYFMCDEDVKVLAKSLEKSKSFGLYLCCLLYTSPSPRD